MTTGGAKGAVEFLEPTSLHVLFASLNLPLMALVWIRRAIIPVGLALGVVSLDVIVDDTNSTISYSPSSQWSEGTQCTTCAIHPDPSSAKDGTWHDTTASPGNPRSITFSFTGTAHYDELVVKLPVISVILNIVLTFLIPVFLIPSNFSVSIFCVIYHIFQLDLTIHSIDQFSLRRHTNPAYSVPPVDWARVKRIQPDKSSSVPKGALIGGAVGGGVLLLILVVALLYLLCKRRARRLLMRGGSSAYTEPGERLLPSRSALSTSKSSSVLVIGNLQPDSPVSTWASSERDRTSASTVAPAPLSTYPPPTALVQETTEEKPAIPFADEDNAPRRLSLPATEPHAQESPAPPVADTRVLERLSAMQEEIARLRAQQAQTSALFSGAVEAPPSYDAA
ncbi:hypothetical protein VTO73DRAFT_199 [Trametes versicolor]